MRGADTRETNSRLLHNEKKFISVTLLTRVVRGARDYDYSCADSCDTVIVLIDI